MSLYVAAVGLPLVGALHQYAYCRGYYNMSCRQSAAESCGVGAVLALLSILVIVAHR
jgi:hypothetical protein